MSIKDFEDTNFSDFETNKKHWKVAWEDKLIDLKNKIEDLGNSWGDVNSEIAKTYDEDILGDYKKIHTEYITHFINNKSIVLDIGVGSGNWIPYFSNAEEVICVDLIEESFKFVRYHYKNLSNLRYYKTEGFELIGIPSNFVNFIFCMDTLVRYKYSDIERYFKEFNRVLVPNGNVCIHLPYKNSKLISKFGFKGFEMQEIESLKSIFSKNKFDIDKNTINHGVLIH